MTVQSRRSTNYSPCLADPTRMPVRVTSALVSHVSCRPARSLPEGTLVARTVPTSWRVAGRRLLRSGRPSGSTWRPSGSGTSGLRCTGSGTSPRAKVPEPAPAPDGGVGLSGGAGVSVDTRSPVSPAQPHTGSATRRGRCRPRHSSGTTNPSSSKTSVTPSPSPSCSHCCTIPPHHRRADTAIAHRVRAIRGGCGATVGGVRDMPCPGRSTRLLRWSTDMLGDNGHRPRRRSPLVHAGNDAVRPATARPPARRIDELRKSGTGTEELALLNQVSDRAT